MEDAKFVIAVLSFLINCGLFGLLFRLNNQWSDMKERGDILWLHYCLEHKIPFRPVGKGFEDWRRVEDKA